MTNSNPYLPEMATILEVIEENSAIKTFRVRLNNEKRMKEFSFHPGQVAQLSMFGVGESTFVINSSPTRMDYLQFSVMRAGEVTTRLHSLQAGDQIGVRAPLGNWFPYENMKGKDVYFIGGGIGVAPLRTLIQYMLDNREDYGNITVLYGARTPDDFCYKEDMAEWNERDDINLIQTVDNVCTLWNGCVGLVPNILLEQNPSPDNAVAVTCGPPIMIKFTLQALQKLKFGDDQIITTLERRMKCGVGLCGRCNLGPQYVCVDGPVYTAAQLKKLPDEM